MFLGDLVSKGPDSAKVVNLAMKLNASCVMGNHDYELLDWMGYIKSVGDTRLDTFINPEDLPNELVLGAEEHSIAMGFGAQAASWMLECPLILKVGEVEGEEFVAVHAGILPDKPLEQQGDRPLYSQDLRYRPMDADEHAEYLQREALEGYKGRRSMGPSMDRQPTTPKKSYNNNIRS